MCKKYFNDIELFQIEKNENQYFLNMKNAQINKISTKVVKEDFLMYNPAVKFDFIVSNPPFYVNGKISRNVSKSMAKHAHHLPMDGFFKKVYALLRPGGYFIFCYDARQIQPLLSLLSTYNLLLSSLKFIYPKPNKSATLVLVCSRKNFQYPYIDIKPPFYLCSKNKHLKETRDIFNRHNLYSIKCSI